MTACPTMAVPCGFDQYGRPVGLHVVEVGVGHGEIEVTLEASSGGVGRLGLRAERLERDLSVWRTKSTGKSLAMAAVAL